MLKVDGLAKAFGELRAVDAVSFTAPDGVITGFLGANGAGKTTVMRMIMGLLLPDAGRISWNGHSLKAETRRRFGYMPEERGLYPKQRVADQLAYFGQLRGLSSRDSNQQAKELLEQFGLADRARAKLETLSLGNQQRVQIIASLMGVPRMLILDEPFSGLDPLATDEMVGLLRSRAREGAPVLFSSHQLELVDRICERVVILSHGRVLIEGLKREITAEESPVYHIATKGHALQLHVVEGIEVHRNDGYEADFAVSRPGAEQEVVRQALHEGELVEFARRQTSLSDVYRRVAQ